VPQSDDGVVVARGRIDGVDAVVLAIEGNYQGGSIGEVNGAKIAGALELALRDARRGRIVRPVLVLDTGGIPPAGSQPRHPRDQRDACGHRRAARSSCRSSALIAGRIGCFGGMGIARDCAAY